MPTFISQKVKRKELDTEQLSQFLHIYIEMNQWKHKLDLSLALANCFVIFFNITREMVFGISDHDNTF